MANGRFGFGNINTPYYDSSNIDDINKQYFVEGAFDIKPTPDDSPGNIGEAMDKTVLSDTTSNPQDPYESSGGIFDQLLGQGVDIYDSQSIADRLMDKYDIKGLSAGMFPAMSKNLMASTKASTYDAYKQMQTNPERIQYRKDVSASAGLLNPNKKRQRAMRAFKAGMGDINRSIFEKTSMAREGVRDWLSSALAKVMRMK